MENQRYSVLFWLYKRRLKEGKSCIYIRITVDGRRVEIATPHYVSEQQWDILRNRVKVNAPDAIFINVR